MAAHVFFSRLSTSLTSTSRLNIPSLNKIIVPSTTSTIRSNCPSHRQIKTCSVLTSSDFRTSEQSWVRKLLKGSGPSEDIDDTLEEDDIVEVEPQYMDIIVQKPQTIFIEQPKVRKRVYKPPVDVIERLQSITRDVIPEAMHDDWRNVRLPDNDTKYHILSRCFTTFNHNVPNFLLSRMQTVEDVVTFYQTEVKDTSKFDDLIASKLPPNLKIYWNYSDDSRLEIYKDYMDYVKVKKNPKPPQWKYRPS